MLVNPGAVRLRRLVRLQSAGDGTLPAETILELQKAHASAQFGNFIELVGAEESAEFVVAAGENGCYEIWDSGGEVIPRINPALALNDEKAADKVIERLIHLTRYRNVQELVNNVLQTRGAPQITFEWIDVSPDHVFALGDVARLRIQNDSRNDVGITLLELAPDWSVTQIYPTEADSYPFAKGESDELVIDVLLEGDQKEETNIYKLFATTKDTNFRMLELPSLDAPLTRGVSAARDNLEAFLLQAVETVPPTRAGRIRSSPGREWTTLQVELRVKR